MTDSERLMIDEWRRLSASLGGESAPPKIGAIIDEICAIPIARWERLGRVLRGEYRE